jgi:prepilin-type N-terminal cleavage/methylation domain-containing protein
MPGIRYRSLPILANGFSLVEMTVALALMVIVTAIAVPGWNRLLPGYQLDSSVRQVQSELHNIKMRAAAENVGFQLQYSDGASSYTIQRDSKDLVTKPLPQGVVISKAGTISFSPRGTAGANRVRLRHPDGLCKQVVVSATGRVRVCKPNDCSGDC